MFERLSFSKKWKRKIHFLFPGLLTMTKFRKRINLTPKVFSTPLGRPVLYTYMSFCSGKTIRIQCAHDAITMIVPHPLGLRTGSLCVRARVYMCVCVYWWLLYNIGELEKKKKKKVLGTIKSLASRGFSRRQHRTCDEYK